MCEASNDNEVNFLYRLSKFKFDFLKDESLLIVHSNELHKVMSKAGRKNFEINLFGSTKIHNVLEYR